MEEDLVKIEQLEWAASPPRLAQGKIDQMRSDVKERQEQ